MPEFAQKPSSGLAADSSSAVPAGSSAPSPDSRRLPRPEIRELAVIVVDHGSRRAESNQMLLELVDEFRRQARYGIVEPAHMELAEPSIDTAFERCVTQGARLIVVFPHFLFPGRHWHQDIPALAAAAAGRHPGIRFLVAAPLGPHPLMLEIMDDRIQHCLRHSQGQEEACSICREHDDRCQIRESGPTPP